MRSRCAWVCAACLAVARAAMAGDAIDPVAIYDAVSPSVGLVVTFDADRYPVASGAGFYVDSPDVFVTQLGLLHGASAASVKTAAGTFVDVLSVVGYDETTGLVALRTEPSGVSPASLATVRPRVGATIILGGSVDGLASAFTVGEITGTLFAGDGSRFYSLDARVGSWNEGAPVLDMEGSVVGVAADTGAGPVAVAAPSIAALVAAGGEDIPLDAVAAAADPSRAFAVLINPTRDLPSLPERRARTGGEKAALLVALALFIVGGYEVANSISP